ncbi:MAG: hypothetical protein ACYDB1_02030 [Acidiferrobacteraceae bacterium]
MLYNVKVIVVQGITTRAWTRGGVMPLKDPSIHLSVEQGQHGLQEFQIFPLNAVALLVSVALFLMADAARGRLGGGAPLPGLLFEPDTPHLTPGKISGLTPLIGVALL